MEETRESKLYLVDSAAGRQNNAIVRPYRRAVVLLVQLDDLDRASIERVQGVAFRILNTSPCNFQAWVAIDNPGGTTDADFARLLRKGAGADLTASGAARVAGTANFKHKYAPVSVADGKTQASSWAGADCLAPLLDQFVSGRG